MTARLLAFDTSTEALAVALVLPGQIGVVETEGGALASARLIPEALGLLARAGCTLQQLDAIAFGRGPGAFTGLRTACSVAQGLALGAAKPVLAIDSLMLVADDACADDDGNEIDCWVAMDARMDEIYAACFRRARGRWQTLRAPCLLGADALNALWQHDAPACVAGTALTVFGERLRPGPAARQVAQPRSRAAALARLAQAAWAAGEAVDAALALPVYVRDKVASTTAERAAARAVAENAKPT
jgi:tRNA threonylcarbamoyladenosine biosynthesis protein TsaB